jgi:hypothetical protein
MSSWYIDTWDGRAGRAFATQREPEEKGRGDDPQGSSGATIFVGPPAFRPELIVNRSIALSAGRAGSFVQRVPVEGPELAFPTAHSVAEFVRRGFCAGGGGRGGGEGGGGGEGVPSTPEGEPPEPLEMETKDNSSVGLQEYCSVFAEGLPPAGGSLGSEARPAPEWPRATGARAPTKTAGPVAAGAVRLLVEMFLRLPRRPTNGAMSVWAASAGSLYHAVSEVEVWSSIQGGTEAYLAHGVERAMRPLGVKVGQGPWGPSSQAIAVLSWAQRYAADPRLWGHWRDILEYGFRYWWPLSSPDLGIAAMSDRFAPMYSWPLPPELRKDVQDASSAGQLLSKFMASPAGFATARPPVFEIILFAAAYLGSRVHTHVAPGWQEQAATVWLTQSLPRWQFSHRGEALIEQVATR